MKVKPYLLLAAVWAALCCATPVRAQLFNTSSGIGAIRSATFAGSGGLGVIPTSSNSEASALSPGGGGSCGAGGCASAGCADGACGVSCADPAGCAACGDIGCSCRPCGCPQCCPCGCGPCGWTHKIGVFGEFLYLRGRNLEVPFAVEQNSNAAQNNVAPVQVSRLGIVDPRFEPGYRAGFSISSGTCSSFTMQYTMWESSTTNLLALSNAGTDVIGLVFHPATQAANSGGIFSQAFYNHSFDLIDADYRELLSYGPCHKINAVVGGGYANLEQQFGAQVPINGNETVFTDIDFDGAGLRLGLEMERYSRGRKFMWYGKGITSILAGKFRADYFQGMDFDNSVVNTRWTGDRIVPIVQIETGTAIQFHDGAYRLSAGYVYNAWFNTVKTQDWINAVQNNSFTGLSDTMTFDGLVGRFEARF